MIFTQEQIERLPGSTVRLRDGRACEVFYLNRHRNWFSEFRTEDERLALANTSPFSAESTIDIVEVIRWADEPAKQPTTIREWLETIEDEGARKRALAEAVAHGTCDNPADDFREALMFAFAWRATKEGIAYWAAIHENGPAHKPAKPETKPFLHLSPPTVTAKDIVTRIGGHYFTARYEDIIADAHRAYDTAVGKRDAARQRDASWESLARHFQAELRSARSDKAALLNSMQEAVSSMQRAINNARMLTPHPDRMSAEATEMLREIMEGGE